MENLTLVRTLIHRQEIGAHVASIIFEFLRAVRILVGLVVKLQREAHFDDESRQRQVICDVAQSVENLL